MRKRIWVRGVAMVITALSAGCDGAGFVFEAPGAIKYQYASYRASVRVNPLAHDSREIRARLVPGMRGVDAWKAKWPLRAANRYWAMDPRLLPYFDDGAVDGRGGFLLPYVGPEAPPWRAGDLVLLPGDTEAVATPAGDWVRALLDRGRLRRVGEAEGLAGYVVEE